MMKYDVHNYGRQLISAQKYLEEDLEILPENRKTIKKFDDYLLTLGLTVPRRVKYMYLLRLLSRKVNKLYEDITKEDIVSMVAEIQGNTKLTEWSKTDKKITLKRFYKWLKGNDEVYPPEVRWIKCRVKNDRIKLPEELLTQEEVKLLADAANKPRDKAMVQCLYETGCRIGELLTIQIKNVVFDNYGALLRVSGKTGERRIRIVASAPALATWLDFHPYRNNPEAFVWLRNLHKGAKDTLPFRYTNAMLLIRELAQKAGVNKRVNPHSFRHARATALANKLTEAQMKEYFGWVQGSDMASVYVHLSGRDMDDALLNVYGLKKGEKKDIEKFRPINCNRCTNSNSPGSKLCNKCGYNLVSAPSVEQGGTQTGLMAALMNDPEFRELMLRKMLENKSEVSGVQL